MNDTIERVRDIRLFGEFPAADLQNLASRLVEVALAPGEVLFWEGDPGDHMYFVREGTLLVSKAVADGVDEVLARLGAGEVLGEMSVLDGSPRCATVRAESRAVLFVLSRQSFEEIVAASPRLAALFFRAHARAAVARLRASDDLVTETARWGLESTGLDIQGAAPADGGRPSPTARTPAREHGALDRITA